MRRDDGSAQTQLMGLCLEQCRAMFFPTVSEATRLWIKGREFSVEKMLGEKYADRAKAFENASLAIFRLAPQDYHRCASR